MFAEKIMQCCSRFFATLLAAGFFLVVLACTPDEAKSIVNNAIEVHGGDAYRSFQLSFDFRDRHYTAVRNNGLFTYTRSFTDSTGAVEDILDNEGFRRIRNGAPVSLPAERVTAFSNSVNAVIYFVLLPFGLNDDPVRKERIGETVILGEPYNVVRVTFDAGKDTDVHEDIYVYWFHRDRHTMDYFAYSYETEGGGIRFRQAVNPRRVGGIIFQDYDNFKPLADTISLDRLPALFEAGKLTKVSDIDLKNIQVTPN